MHRKITRTGPATLTIALPAKWAKENNLEPGNEIEINEIENKLIISTTDEENKESRKIPYNETLIEEMLEKLYKENTSQIIIEDQDQIPNSINEIISKFPGLKIIEEEKNKIIIERTLQPILTNPSAILKRIYLLIKNSFETNPANFKDLEELLLLNTLQNKDSRENETLSMIFKTLSSIDKPIFDETYSYLRSIFNLIYKQKYFFKNENAIQLEKLFNESESLFEKYSGNESPIILAKAFHCIELFKTLNRIIITQQSIEVLQKQTLQANKKFKVGICLKNNSNKFWREYVRGGMEEVQEEYPNIEFIHKSPFVYPETNEQEKIIDEFISMQINLIIIAPNHPTKLNKIIQKAIDEGIQVLIIDTEIKSKNTIPFIGWDNYNGGVLSAKALQSKLKKNSKVLIIEGQREGNFHERVTGFENTIKDCKTDVISGDFQQSVAYKESLKYLKENKVDAVYATSDNMALGVLQATKELNLELPISGFDATEDSRDLIKKGKMVSTIDSKPRVLGSLAIETANKILTEKQISMKTIYDVELIS